ncbi:hypothetical protein [Ruegeria arenilitoris]|uniref:hypothetical protein n=1 Tax=Ruegeria arenilitoris TaxID=1173585 RepID=UPI00147C56BF|nr:hypothetical protein [Ruegeria arenilitoris]
MTPSQNTELTNLIEQAQNGQYVLHYAWGDLPKSSPVRTKRSQWRTKLKQLFATWPDAETSIRAVSYVFTDAPFSLSHFVFDAVVIWDGKRFLRIEADDLPNCFQSSLKEFESGVPGYLAINTGDALLRISDLYHHQLLSGQAYLTTDTLTVMNINGNSATSVPELTPNLPYAVTVLLTGKYAEVTESDPETAAPGGAYDIPIWAVSEQHNSRVSETHCKNHFPAHWIPTAEDIERINESVRKYEAEQMKR